MNQPIHILKKDARHLWPEIAVTVALLLALVWVTPHNHGAPDVDLPWLYPVLGGFIKFLIPITWLVLISRLVHDEPLVGDRQFWITRPYTWYGLLAAKLLFVLAFIYLPLLLAQSYLLHHAGVHPMLAAWPFIKNFGGITAIIVLPLLALAAVTSTFVRFALSVLGAIVYLIAVIAIAALTVPNKIDVPYMGTVQEILLVAVPLAALLLQYGWRKTAVARTLLIALPAVILLLFVITPASALIGHEYAAALPIKATFNADPRFQQQEAGDPFVFRKKMAIQIPVVLDGLSDKTNLHSQHANLKIDGPNGYHYETGWVEAFNNLNPGPRASALHLQLPIAVYNRIKDGPVAMHITLGVERFEPTDDYNVPATVAPFPAPHHGACNFAEVRTDDPTSATVPGTLPHTMNCNYAFGNPAVTSVEAETSAGPCPASGAVATAPADPASPRMSAFLAPSPSVPELDPVASDEAAFGPGLTDPRFNPNPTTGTLCPGAKIHFTELKSTAKGSITVDIPAITPSAYAVRVSASPQRLRR